MSRYFTVQNEITRHYRRFNTEGKRLTVWLTTPASSSAAGHCTDRMDAIFEYSLRDLEPSDMVGISIYNVDNQQDRPIGLSFRRRDQISRVVLWSVFDKVTQSNATYQAVDNLTFHVHSIGMPVGLGKKAEKSKGRPLSKTAHLKRSIVEVKARDNCLVHALVIAVARLANDPNYKAYRQGRKILPKVRELLQASGVDLGRGGGIPELQAFQRHLSQYRIVVYSGLRCDG